MEVASFTDAMLSQPVELARLEARLDARRVAFPEGVVRWRLGDTVVLAAMGAAHHSTHALAWMLRAHGFRAAPVIASEALGSSPAALGDHLLVVTESGRSPEPIALAREFPRGRRLVITNEPGGAVSEVADAVIDLGGFPDSRAYTVGFTATLVAYERLARALGVPANGGPSISSGVQGALDAFTSAAGDLADTLAGASAVDVVGSGASYAAAAEIALLARECLRIPSTAFPTHQYLHGPMESVGRGTTVVILGDGRERLIPSSLAGSGARFVVIGRPRNGEAAHFDTGATEGFARVAVETVAGQRLMAAAIGRLPFEIEEFVHGQSDTKV